MLLYPGCVCYCSQAMLLYLGYATVPRLCYCTQAMLLYPGYATVPRLPRLSVTESLSLMQNVLSSRLSWWKWR